MIKRNSAYYDSNFTCSIWKLLFGLSDVKVCPQYIYVKIFIAIVLVDIPGVL